MEIAVLFCIALGAAIGSFVALVFDRALRRESIVAPPSHCFVCNARIKARDIIPIFSWLALRGRCRSCKAFIPLHAVLLEVAGAVAGGVLATQTLRP
ncbi:MAG: hypothetical protein NVS1B2_15350 [Vulcanimicrobiaceae bacterium]